ncbi:MAG: 2Fe-2S iron-sulfur cluster-binding protein [Terriglobales bacterium]
MKDQAMNPQTAPDLKIPVPRGPLPILPSPGPSRTVDINIDGKSVSVSEGSTILEAARSIGIDTPTLCFLENLTPVNACRICVVELEGSRALVPACSRQTEAGMVVKTDSERVRLSRRLVLEMLASSVDVSTAPQFQEYMRRFGARPERFGESASPAGARDEAQAGHHRLQQAGAETVAQPVKIDNDLYVRDYGKCILCYKCVEACGVDAQNTFAIAVAGRGFGARISTEYNTPLTDSACVYCGNCIGVCPTGALMFRSEYEMRQAGTWAEAAQTRTDTICPYCGVGCTLTLQVQDEKIVKVTSPLDQEITAGHLCIKGRFGWEWVNQKK